MIVLDCEATGLPEPSATASIHHPWMCELTMMRLDEETYEIKGERTWMFRPGVLPVPTVFTKITGITTDMVKDQPSFASQYLEIAKWCVGETQWAAHNASYDMEVLRVELDRLGLVTRFPWPIHVTCTMERTQHITGKYLKLVDLWSNLFEKEAPPQEHRSRSDTLMLAQCVQALAARGDL